MPNKTNTITDGDGTAISGLDHSLESKYSLGEGAKKNIKKLTNVSLYVCMSAENSKMLVFLMFFFPNSSLKDNFQNRGFEPYWIVSWVQGVSKC